MLSKTVTGNLDGVEGKIIHVEAEILNGFSAFYIVGLPSTSILESKERIRSALHAVDIAMPLGRIIVNLYPASDRKVGSHYDLPILVAMLGAMKLVSLDRLTKFAYLGELSLDGKIRRVTGALSLALKLKEEGYDKILLPKDNLQECSVVNGASFYPCIDLAEVIKFLQGQDNIKAYKGKSHRSQHGRLISPLDYSDIVMQSKLKRLMTIAAAGRHSLLLIGPPGVGKTMSIQRLPTILPALNEKRQLECSSIYSTINEVEDDPLIIYPPFRSPHYSASKVALMGGGVPVKPGEITLAHNGTLFLDELLQFPSRNLELLRIPMETRKFSINRSGKKWRLPANFQLVASTNPCPCGNHGDPEKECRCTAFDINRYLNRLSRPLLDRLDLIMEIKRPYKKDEKAVFYSERETTGSSDFMYEQVVAARLRQRERYAGKAYQTNGEIPDVLALDKLDIDREGMKTLQELVQHYQLSLRTHRKLALVARTIADLEASDTVNQEHMLEAFQYIKIRFKYWK